jgi:hypothetical protein
MTGFETLRNTFTNIGVKYSIMDSELYFGGKKIAVFVNSMQEVDYHFRDDGKHMTVLIWNTGNLE